MVARWSGSDWAARMTCGTGKVCPPLAMSKNTSVLEKLGSLDHSVSTGKGGEGV